jgi:putative membrane protein
MNRRTLMTAAVGTTALAMLPVAVLAQSAGAATDEAKLPALLNGNFSTATSQVAKRKASSPALRNFADMEIKEQAAVAKAFGAAPSATEITADKAPMLDQLNSAEGAAFNAMYINGQIAGHRELLRTHEAYARSGQDPMARGASIVGVTGIETHLFLLENIRRQI